MHRSNRGKSIIQQAWIVAGTVSTVFSGIAFPQEKLPAPLSPGENDYRALIQTSPFQRTLNISETYALRGVAQFDDIVWATLYNKETKKTVLINPDKENEFGLKLVEVIPSLELSGVAAKVSFAGEVAELHYDAAQLESKGAGRKGGGSSSSKSGERKGPSKEDMKRYQTLNDDNKKKLREYIGTVMKKYPDMPREERGNLIRGALIRLSDGRGLKD